MHKQKAYDSVAIDSFQEYQRQTTWRPVFSFADMQQKEAQLLQQNHVMHCQLKSCQLLHNCKKTHIKRLAIGGRLRRPLTVIRSATILISDI